jgi:hypothetical protein
LQREWAKLPHGYVASAHDKSEVLAREVNASPGSFIAGVRFDLRWDPATFSELCEALQAATKQHVGSRELPRDLSQLFWYCATFIPVFVQQRDFTVGQSHVNYEKACSLLKRLGDAWFADDSLLADDELARELAAMSLQPNGASGRDGPCGLRVDG